MSHIADNVPQWDVLINDVGKFLGQVVVNNFDFPNVDSWSSFWQAVGQFFVGVFAYLKGFFGLLVLVPTKILIFLTQTIIAFLPFDFNFVNEIGGFEL